jgi:hypothetical protein
MAIVFGTGNTNYSNSWQTDLTKWNPIEHRLFSFISLNWAGKPLRSLRWMTALIRGTTTNTGLIVKAAQLKGHYPTKVKVSDAEMATMNLTHRRICPQWNYLFHPRQPSLQNT